MSTTENNPTSTLFSGSGAAAGSTVRTKNLQEIINTWTNELDAQVKEFHKQAAKVNEWDRKLIDNGDKVRFKIYSRYRNL